MKGLTPSNFPSPLTSSILNPAHLYRLIVGFMAAQIFKDIAFSMAAVIGCFIAGMIVVTNSSPSIVSISAQMHIRRYFGSIDAKEGGVGRRTSLLGRRVVFPVSAAVCGPYIFNAISMLCGRTGRISRCFQFSTCIIS